MIRESPRPNQSIAPDGIIAYGRDVTISMLAGQILGSQFITLPMARGSSPSSRRC